MRLVSYIFLEHLFLSILFNSFMKLFHADKLVFPPPPALQKKNFQDIFYGRFLRKIVWKNISLSVVFRKKKTVGTNIFSTFLAKLSEALRDKLFFPSRMLSKY